MKKILLLSAAMLLIAVVTESCAGKKVAKATYPEYSGKGNTGVKKVVKQEEELDECEVMSMEAPKNELRAYGSATDEDRDFARQQAVLFAKAQLVSDIKSLTLSTMKGYREKTKKNGLSTSGADIEQDAGMMAEEIVENCKIICSKRYALSDGTYECAVCISTMTDSAEEVAGAIALSEDEKLSVKFDAEKFRESYKEQLERYRAIKDGK